MPRSPSHAPLPISFMLRAWCACSCLGRLPPYLPPHNMFFITLPPNRASSPPFPVPLCPADAGCFPCLVERSTQLLCPRAGSRQHSRLLLPAWGGYGTRRHPFLPLSAALAPFLPAPGVGLLLFFLTRWQFLVEGVHQCVNPQCPGHLACESFHCPPSSCFPVVCMLSFIVCTSVHVVPQSV